MSFLNNDHLCLSEITSTKAAFAPQLRLVNHAKTVLNLKMTLDAINNNETLYATPFDACFSQTLDTYMK